MTINVDENPLIQHAINEIYTNYGVRVSVNAKAKDLIKYGRSPNVLTTPSTIWYTGQDDANETYVADNVNSIDTISSSSGSDTEVVNVEGHTMTGGDRTFVVQQATLDGQNKVTLTTPLNRVSRVRHAQESSTSVVGEVYVYEDTPISAGKPTDTTKIHLTMPAGQNTSAKASTTVSALDYWIVTGFRAGLQEKTVNLIATIAVQVRPSGGVFYPIANPLVVASGRSDAYQFMPYVIIPANADIRMVAAATISGTEISGGISGFLAKVVA